MNGRTLARAAAAVTSLGVGAVLTLSGTAAAAPEPTPPPTPAESGLTKLGEIAEKDPDKQAGVEALRQYTRLVTIAAGQNIGSAYIPFAYAAPTFGCGSNGPITTVIAAVTTTGPNADEGRAPDPGTLRFSATPGHPGLPLSSGLTVAWVNMNTGASGIDALDDVTEYRLPSLSKTVNSGPGTVLASMWGTINFPGALCVMTPTVGTFAVPDVPVEAAPAPAPTEQFGAPGPDVHITGTTAPQPGSPQPAPEPQIAQPALAETQPAPAAARPQPPAAASVDQHTN
ncbi:hypothetical protein D5S18_01760 [Nocardia panacis]|uniref:Uncharacterized protein n=1 Tax=Nocardia panacis TaxID=2340916 RepID=A0A3A4KU26_9NOCA|nr:hypothetical protein [Nocardia panacis]RJO79997.1 hypothetical protein D5S18_01760 [Nocardia panacis]